MSDEYIGVVKIFAGGYVPRNYLECNGQLLSISQYTALFSVIGASYGGNGQTTFALPDLRGCVPVGQGQLPGGSFYTQGERTGQENVTLNTNQMPSHTHTPRCYASPGTTASPVNAVWAGAPGGRGGNGGSDPTAYAPSADTSMSPSALTAVGGNQPFSVLQPLLVIRYIICVQGIFPSRPN